MKNKLLFTSLILIAIIILFNYCKDDDDTQLDKDKSKIEQFLSENNISAQVYNDVYYVTLKEGTGEQCVAGDTVAVKYKMSTLNYPDAIVDKTDRDKSTIFFLPTEIPSTSAGLIIGFQYAMETMKEGGISRFYIPSSYAYGSDAIGGGVSITTENGTDTTTTSSTYANLIYEIELCEIIHNGKKH